jgi:hypothetical protein
MGKDEKQKMLNVRYWRFAFSFGIERSMVNVHLSKQPRMGYGLRTRLSSPNGTRKPEMRKKVIAESGWVQEGPGVGLSTEGIQ